MAGVSAAVLADWAKPVFAGDAARPFGAGARIPAGRIQRLLALALDHDVRPPATSVKYDPADMNLPEPVRIGKRLKEYMAAQPVTLREDEELVGWLTFDGSVESDLFQRIGHRHFRTEGYGPYYRKPQDALATFEWQHSCIDFEKVVRFGLVRLREEIAQSRRKWSGNCSQALPPYSKASSYAMMKLEWDTPREATASGRIMIQ